MQAEIL